MYKPSAPDPDDLVRQLEAGVEHLTGLLGKVRLYHRQKRLDKPFYGRVSLCSTMLKQAGCILQTGIQYLRKEAEDVEGLSVPRSEDREAERE